MTLSWFLVVCLSLCAKQVVALNTVEFEAYEKLITAMGNAGAHVVAGAFVFEADFAQKKNTACPNNYCPRPTPRSSCPSLATCTADNSSILRMCGLLRSEAGSRVAFLPNVFPSKHITEKQFRARSIYMYHSQFPGHGISNLEGTFPSEMGLLSSLTYFVRERFTNNHDG